MHKGKNSIIRLLIFVLSVSLSTNVTAAENIIYVDDDATGANDGSSWQNAYTYLQDALADANDSEKHALAPPQVSLSNEPVEIRVAQGIYKPDQGAHQTPDDPNATFQLICGVTLKGGYAGVHEPDPDACDSELYKTILSGDLVGNDVLVDYAFGYHPSDFRFTVDLADYNFIFYEYESITDNSFRIVTAAVADSNTSLDGFVVTAAIRGAGLYVGYDSNITVQNCVFTENAASGIFIEVSDPTITDCIFSNNGASNGGGISIYYGDPHIIRCTFIKNSADVGGGIYNLQGNPQIIGCIFKNNMVDSGGGLYDSGGRLWLEDCTFARNFGYTNGSCGGGIFSAWSCAESVIKNCTFSDNVAITGGGIYFGREPHWPPGRLGPSFNEEKILLTDCTFAYNRAFSGGAIQLRESTLEARHCMFSRNSALDDDGRGGAIDAPSSVMNLSHCVFSGNFAAYSGASISALGHHPSGLTLDGCTLTGNFCPIDWALVCGSDNDEELDNNLISNCIFDNGSNEIRFYGNSKITFAYTNLHGGIDTIYDPCEVLIWSEGNIDVDPLFTNPGYWADARDPNIIVEPSDPNAVWVDGDYHLKSQAGRWDPESKSWVIDQTSSPCIDAGDPNRPVGDEPEPNGGRINMGAYGGTAEASKSYLTE